MESAESSSKWSWGTKAEEEEVEVPKAEEEEVKSPTSPAGCMNGCPHGGDCPYKNSDGTCFLYSNGYHCLLPEDDDCPSEVGCFSHDGRLYYTNTECGSKYYIGGVGTTCPDETSVIRSKAECEEALSLLGRTYTSNFWSGSTSGIPVGCSIRASEADDCVGGACGDNMGHFETSASGVGAGRGDLQPVCKVPGESKVVLNVGTADDAEEAGGKWKWKKSDE